MGRERLVIISTGNEGQTSQALGYSQAIFVGAVNTASEIASFSDRGPFVDLVAPGTAIRTTDGGGEYAMVNGTSFAAPIVAGVAALGWSVNPDLRPVTIATALQDTAVDLGNVGTDDAYGYGLVDAAAAVDEAARLTFTPDSTGHVHRRNRICDGYAIAVSVCG